MVDVFVYIQIIDTYQIMPILSSEKYEQHEEQLPMQTRKQSLKVRQVQQSIVQSIGQLVEEWSMDPQLAYTVC